MFDLEEEYDTVRLSHNLKRLEFHMVQSQVVVFIGGKREKFGRQF